jgi:hypothetical protein
VCVEIDWFFDPFSIAICERAWPDPIVQEKKKESRKPGGAQQAALVRSVGT